MKSSNKILGWLKRTIAIAIPLVAAALAYPSTAEAHNYLGQCTPNFSSTFALTNIYANARATFAFPTSFNSSGALDFCSNAAPGNSCWTFRQRCWNDYVNVEDLSNYGHFHLSFSDPAMNILVTKCAFADPHDGYGAGYQKLVNRACVTPNWKTEPRHLNSHDGSQWIGIQMRAGGTTTNTIFDMPRIRIGGTTPVQLWFHSTIDNLWHFWSSLVPNNYDLSTFVHDVDQVEISGAAGQTASFEIDDFDILD